eukprot:4183239-Lingulodinium_polyedra.AAC.1
MMIDRGFGASGYALGLPAGPSVGFRRVLVPGSFLSFWPQRWPSRMICVPGSALRLRGSAGV